MSNPQSKPSELNQPIWSVVCAGKAITQHQTYSNAWKIAKATEQEMKHKATVITDKAAERIK